MPKYLSMSSEENNDCVKEAKKKAAIYLTIREIVEEIEQNKKYEFPCSENQVRQALQGMYGTTGSSNQWELPTDVDPILYQRYKSGYKWHHLLVKRIYKRIHWRKEEFLDLQSTRYEAYLEKNADNDDS
jgi:hypothetical protein